METKHKNMKKNTDVEGLKKTIIREQSGACKIFQGENPFAANKRMIYPKKSTMHVSSVSQDDLIREIMGLLEESPSGRYMAMLKGNSTDQDKEATTCVFTWKNPEDENEVTGTSGLGKTETDLMSKASVLEKQLLQQKHDFELERLHDRIDNMAGTQNTVMEEFTRALIQAITPAIGAITPMILNFIEKNNNKMNATQTPKISGTKDFGQMIEGDIATMANVMGAEKTALVTSLLAQIVSSKPNQVDSFIAILKTQV